MDRYTELNLDQVLKAWSSDMYQKTSRSDGVEPDKLDFIFDLMHVKFRDTSPKFHQESTAQPCMKDQVICSRRLNNDTDELERHHLKFSGETASVATVTMTTALILDKKTRLNLLELPMEDQTGGFWKELAVTGLGSQEFNLNKPYRVEETVVIPAQESRQVEMKTREKLEKYFFQVETKVKGKVCCRIVNKDDDKLVSFLEGNIVQILESYGRKTNGLLQDGLSINDDKAIFTSKGILSFKTKEKPELHVSAV